MPSLDTAALEIDPDRTAASLDTPHLGEPLQDETDALTRAVLAAVVDMALRSKRRQADLEAALCHGGIETSRLLALQAADTLSRQGWVDNVVPLHDGGVLLSVTALGLEAAGRHRAT
jgi:hypothetical protein